MCTYFKAETDVAQNLIDDFFYNFGFQEGRILSEKNMGVRGYFLKKRKLYIQNFCRSRFFFSIFIRCLWLRNPIPKFRLSYFISKKPGYLSEKLKILLKFCTRFLLHNVYKGIFGIFVIIIIIIIIIIILLRSWVTNKNVKNLASEFV